MTKMENNKKTKIGFYISTGLVSALMLMSASMYVFNHEMVEQTFVALGYPTYIIYPLAILKILGIVAIWSNKSKTLKEWAYAGFAFDFILAAAAHISIQDNEYGGAVVAIGLLTASYLYDKKLGRSLKTQEA